MKKSKKEIYYNTLLEDDAALLVNSYACHPQMGSEHAVGFSWIKKLVASNSLIIYAEIESAIVLSKYAEEHQWKALIIGVDIGEVARINCWNQGAWKFYFSYSLWQFRVMVDAFRLSYSLTGIWQLNMIGFREPGYLWILALARNIRYIWGPIGGGNIIPLQYCRELGFRVLVVQFFKNCLNYACLLSPSVQLAALRAHTILVCSNGMFGFFHRGLLFNRKLSVVSECQFIDFGSGFNELLARRQNKELNILKIALSGKDVPRKGYFYLQDIVRNFLIKFYRLGLSCRIQFQVYGIKAGDTLNLDLPDSVVICGILARNEYIESLAQCDIFLHLALDEAGPVSAFEARRLGMPVVGCRGLGVFNDVPDYPYFFEYAKSNFRERVSDALLRCATDVLSQKLVLFPQSMENNIPYINKRP